MPVWENLGSPAHKVVRYSQLDDRCAPLVGVDVHQPNADPFNKSVRLLELNANILDPNTEGWNGFSLAPVEATITQLTNTVGNTNR